MITITEKAAEKIKEIADSEGLTTAGIRLSILGRSCSGFAYDLSLEDQVNDNDHVTETDSIKIIVEQDILEYVKNASIDYDEIIIGGGFRIFNPDQGGCAGCNRGCENE